MLAQFQRAQLRGVTTHPCVGPEHTVQLQLGVGQQIAVRDVHHDARGETEHVTQRGVGWDTSDDDNESTCARTTQ